MVEITISANQGNQRLDRFLKKYLQSAPLSYIYKMIRKDVRINGKRSSVDFVLQEGDQLCLYLTQEQIDRYSHSRAKPKAKRQFSIAYEDEAVLVVTKPFGLLTHGDAKEKVNTLVNQVCGYLQDQGVYDPSAERTFTPAPVNRLDRNTTGLVVFGKTLSALQSLNRMMQQQHWIRKYYLTIVKGEMKTPLHLLDKMEKDKKQNRISVKPASQSDGKVMETIARPLQRKGGYTLVEVELVTGRTHQIRAHLSQRGFPVIGDAKYGDVACNRLLKKRFGLGTQMLHAYKLVVQKTENPLKSLEGKTIGADLPKEFQRIKSALFD